jgi:hypothetical protein
MARLLGMLHPVLGGVQENAISQGLKPRLSWLGRMRRGLSRALSKRVFRIGGLALTLP